MLNAKLYTITGFHWKVRWWMLETAGSLESQYTTPTMEAENSGNEAEWNIETFFGITVHTRILHTLCLFLQESWLGIHQERFIKSIMACCWIHQCEVIFVACMIFPKSFNVMQDIVICWLSYPFLHHTNRMKAYNLSNFYNFSLIDTSGRLHFYSPLHLSGIREYRKGSSPSVHLAIHTHFSVCPYTFLHDGWMDFLNFLH